LYGKQKRTEALSKEGYFYSVRSNPSGLIATRLLLGEYIHFYNYERIQLKTKLTPYEKRCQFQGITRF
jgi:hypothetical protein